jgi:hypothetical protein
MYEMHPTLFLKTGCDSEGVKNGVACDLVEGILSGVCFASSEMGVEVAGGGIYRRATLMVVLGCGVVVMDQMKRGSRRDMGRGPVVGDNGGGGCAAKGVWGASSVHGGGLACEGHG